MLIEPLIGAVIGYFTNWLAIKMIFKPHTEKRIFGLRIPFTPGLIPKERYVLSKKIGNVVATHLLTDEVIIKSLVNENMHENIDNLMDRGIKYLAESEVTLTQLADKICGCEADMWIGLENILSNYILNQLKSEETAQKLCCILNEQLQKLIKTQIKDMPIENARLWINQMFIQYGKEYIESEEFEKIVSENINNWKENIKNSDKKLGEIMPDKAKVCIVEGIQEKTQPISLGIIKVMEKPDTEKKLKEIILKFIDENIGKIITVFISPIKIYEGIIKAIKEYLSNENNYVDISNKLISFINTVYEMPAKEVYEKIPEEFKNYPLENTLTNTIRKFTTEENISKITGSLTSGLNKFEEKSLHSVLIKAEPDIENKIQNFIYDFYKKISENDKLNSAVHSVLSSQLDKLKAKKLNDAYALIPEEIISALKKNIIYIYDKTIAIAMIDILKAINISKMVEDRINEFDMDFTEDIILGVVNKELKAITWLGGLLGFIIGLLMLLI